MTEQEYLEFLGQVSYITYLHPHLDRRDVAHDIFLDTGSISQRVNRYRNKISTEIKNAPICCGGFSDFEYAYHILNTQNITIAEYQYCPHCDSILPLWEFRKQVKICKKGEAERKIRGEVKLNPVKLRQKNIRGQLKRRNSITDGYIKDILKKTGKEVTPEAIRNKRKSLIRLRKSRLLKYQREGTK